MALDPTFVGRTFPPSAPYEVGREKIAEFARAIGDHHPAYFDPDAARALGHPDVIAPPTFPNVFVDRAGTRLLTDPDLGLDFTRVVHGEQRFVYTRPVRAGDRLVCEITVDSIRAVAGNDILGVRFDVRTQDGSEQVVTVHTTLVARGTAHTPETAQEGS
ncbi:MAG TPA: MaoC family dehydratase N-terminal domain-containing protein [Cryptosporangiaceae bacterium]|nr:MaoC family dehydratase N-terminal domain-containing protein [Cryptosporangiaceae bacterium]